MFTYKLIYFRFSERFNYLFILKLNFNNVFVFNKLLYIICVQLINNFDKFLVKTCA